MKATIKNKRTYCNPLPLPDYPRGNLSRLREHCFGWESQRKQDFRETADPSVLYHEGKWYLYPSCGMVYMSEDFVTWQHQRIEPYNLGYAPTIVKHRDQFILTASRSGIYAADHPLGPFKELGPILDKEGEAVPRWADPMLFSDDDGRLFAYWGLGAPGIYGAELDADDPTRMISDPQVLFSYNPDHVWERVGDYNEDPSHSYVEGAWMLKENGRYYLTYCAPGTEFRSYALGTYVGDSPLGPFRYQENNPLIRSLHGIVQGTGHGCFTRGPNNTLWAFYTCLIRNEHKFERRVGVDPAGFDEQGQLVVAPASHTPQWAPGLISNPEKGNSTGLLAVSTSKAVSASSEDRVATARHVLDDIPNTFWEAEAEDGEPWLRIDMGAVFRIEAMRLMWAEPHLDYEKGETPRAMRYRLIDEATGNVILDRTENSEDWLIDYHTFPAVRTQTVKLEILRDSDAPPPAISNLTLFGLSEAKGPPE